MFRRLNLPPSSSGSEGHLLCMNADGSVLTCWRLGCWFSANQRCNFGNSSSGSKLVLIRVFWVGYWLWTVWKANGGHLKSSAIMAAYLLHPRSTVLLEKLTASQLVKKFPAFYETRRFITAFTSARRLSLS